MLFCVPRKGLSEQKLLVFPVFNTYIISGRHINWHYTQTGIHSDLIRLLSFLFASDVCDPDIRNCLHTKYETRVLSQASRGAQIVLEPERALWVHCLA
jgi:hypothetical protein